MVKEQQTKEGLTCHHESRPKAARCTPVSDDKSAWYGNLLRDAEDDCISNETPQCYLAELTASSGGQAAFEAKVSFPHTARDCVTAFCSCVSDRSAEHFI